MNLDGLLKNDRLERCPFCGSKVSMVLNSTMQEIHIYHSDYDNPFDCLIEPFRIDTEDFDKAIEIWNRRCSDEVHL
jgi:hypothetical protein